MPPPSDFLPAHPLPISQLVPEHKVIAQLTAPGAKFEVEERVVDGRLLKVWKTLPASVRDFWNTCAGAFGPREYLVYQDTRLTYSQTDAEVRRAARWLRSTFQVRKGDRVGILCRNIPEFVIVYWAIGLLGAVAVAVNAFSETDILAFCVRDVDCRVIVCDVERWERIAGVQPDLAKAGLQGVVVVPRKGNGWVGREHRAWVATRGVWDWEELQTSSAATDCGPSLDSIVIVPEDDSTILFTSGTTSTPKAVLSTQRQNMSTLLLAGYATARAYLRRGLPLPPAPAPGPDPDATSLLLLVPLFHTTGLHSSMTGITARGGKLVLMSKWAARDALDLLERERVSAVVGIGFMVREMLHVAQSEGRTAALRHLHSLSHGGASAAQELPSEAQGAKAGVLTSIGWGLTETNGVAASVGADDYHARPTSTGVPPPAVDLKIVDPETLVAVPPGEVGEVWVRSPGNAKCYLNRPEATAEAFHPDGWFRSGDLGRIDPADGFLYILDRAKDMIIRGGENVSCRAVEDGVYCDRRVGDCAAVPLPDPHLGEQVAVVVVPRRGERPSEGDIHKAALVLPKHMRPTYVWIRDEPLERNANGKVLKHVLKKTVRERWEAEQAQQKRQRERESKL